MKTKEQILIEIEKAMQLNKEAKAKCNQVLSDEILLISHDEKELQSCLESEYKRGINEAWWVARDLFNDKYANDICKFFGECSSVDILESEKYNPLDIKQKLKELQKAHESEEDKYIKPGDKVENNNDGRIATILNVFTASSENKLWVVYVNGKTECWSETIMIKTGKHVDI